MSGPRAYAPEADYKLDPRPIIRHFRPTDASDARDCRVMLRGAAFCMVAAATVFLGAIPSAAVGEELAARRARLRNELSDALDARDRWLGSGSNGDAWRSWLSDDELRFQLDPNSTPNVTKLHEVARLYRSDANGLRRSQFQKVRGAIERWAHTLPAPAAGELAELARSVEVLAVSIDGKRKQADRAKLQTAFDDLEGYLARSKENGTDWRTYLASDTLAAELGKANDADLDRLETILARYNSGHAGLELDHFRNVQQALTTYCRSLRAYSLDDQPAELSSRLERLAKSLEKYEQRRRWRELKEIGACLAWLERHGLAQHVVRAVRRQYAQPNLYAKIAADVVLPNFEQQIDEEFAISDSMGGANITGTARLQGHVGFRLVPNDEKVVMQMLFDGTLQSETTGRSGPVGFSGSGRTQLTAQKSVFADADGVTSTPAVAQAQTSLSIGGVWSTFQGPLMDHVVTKIGWKKVLANRSSSERAVSDKAQRDLRTRVEAEADELVSAMNETYVQMVRVPLKEKGVFPRDLILSSTSDHLCIQATQSAPEQLAAMSPPPEFGREWAASLAIHESLINNTTATALSGVTIQSYELTEVLKEIIGSVPQEFDNVDGISWSLTLADNRPLEVRMADGTMRITLRCQKITAGPEEFNVPFAVSASYRGSIDGNSIVLERLGPLDVNIAMLGAGPKSNDGLTDPKDEVAKRFEMMFQEKLQFSASQLPIDPPPGVEIVPTEFVSKDGWLLVAFDLLTDTQEDRLADNEIGD